MSHRKEIRESFEVNAPLALVFDQFADHNKFGALLGGFSKLAKTGKNQVNGVGSVRRVGPWPISFYEEVTDFEEGKKIVYSVSKGSPLKNHQGRVYFEQKGNKTLVKYEMDFEPRIPFTGDVLKLLLNNAFNTFSKKQFDKLEKA